MGRRRWTGRSPMAEPQWGVTAMQAVEEMDAGPIWATQMLRPAYRGPAQEQPVQRAEWPTLPIEVIHEVVAKAGDPAFTPEPLDYARSDVWGRLRPMMRQPDRQFSWSDSTAEIVRRIRAADGSPGVDTVLCGVAVTVFDAHPGPHYAGPPGSVARRRHGAVLVHTGDGSVWIGHVRRPNPAAGSSVKLPATMALADQLTDVPETLDAAGPSGHHEISYRRAGRRRRAALRLLQRGDVHQAVPPAVRRTAARRGTGHAGVGRRRRGVVLQRHPPERHHAAAESRPPRRGATSRRSTTCAARSSPAPISSCVSSVSGNAGAGGVMLALGADRVLLREGVVLNPHYRTMGLYGSEYWTYVLPRRVGAGRAEQLTEQCLPIGSTEAVTIGLADAVLPGRGRRLRAGSHRLRRSAGRRQRLRRSARCQARRPRRRRTSPTT